jgi:hypothetical protein
METSSSVSRFVQLRLKYMSAPRPENEAATVETHFTVAACHFH